jgi:hypothetical protein
VNEEGGEPIAVSSESNSKPTLDTETVTGSGAKPYLFTASDSNLRHQLKIPNTIPMKIPNLNPKQKSTKTSFSLSFKLDIKKSASLTTRSI